GRTPIRVKRLSWSVPSLTGSVFCACGSANAVARAAKGETAVAAPRAEIIPDCLRTSRRDQRALRKRDMGSPLCEWGRSNALKFSALDISDQIDLNQRIPRNTARWSNGRANRGDHSPLSGRIDTVHRGIVLKVVQVDVHLQHLVHRRTGIDEVL